MAGVTFDLQSAKRIAAVVRKVEQTPGSVVGDRRNNNAPGTSFWAMLTGAGDIAGVFHDWVAVQPVVTLASAGNPSTLTPPSMWQFKEPYVAGWGNARELNDNRQIPEGAVVQLTLVGYAPAPSGALPNTSGVQVDVTGSLDPLADIPMYVFSYAVPPQQPDLPMHDHRGNDPHSGGFAFAVYSPGTSLPQQPWYL